MDELPTRKYGLPEQYLHCQLPFIVRTHTARRTGRSRHAGGKVRGDKHFISGINAKNSEVHAAMGICNLKYIDEIIERRCTQWQLYRSLLVDSGRHILIIPPDVEFGCAYFPMVFNDEAELEKVLSELAKKQVFPRRYFYPSLNTLPYLKEVAHCPVSERMANAVLCLPLFHNLKESQIEMICATILNTLSAGSKKTDACV